MPRELDYLRCKKKTHKRECRTMLTRHSSARRPGSLVIPRLRTAFIRRLWPTPLIVMIPMKAGSRSIWWTEKMDLRLPLCFPAIEGTSSTLTLDQSHRQRRSSMTVMGSVALEPSNTPATPMACRVRCRTLGKSSSLAMLLGSWAIGVGRWGISCSQRSWAQFSRRTTNR